MYFFTDLMTIALFTPFVKPAKNEKKALFFKSRITVWFIYNDEKTGVGGDMTLIKNEPNPNWSLIA
jgi:hypothetical protein